jgi:hypothetical protein
VRAAWRGADSGAAMWTSNLEFVWTAGRPGLRPEGRGSCVSIRDEVPNGRPVASSSAVSPTYWLATQLTSVADIVG